jgi:hypothetical protein
MTEMLTERDERGAYIVPMPLKWWKFIFDAKTSTWTKYGALAFVEGRTEAEARTAAIRAGQAEFPQSEILPIAIGETTREAAELYAAKKQRHAVWLENTQQGIPNDRRTLDPAGATPSSSSSSSPLFRSHPPIQLQDSRSAPEWTCPECGKDALWCEHAGKGVATPSGAQETGPACARCGDAGVDTYVDPAARNGFTERPCPACAASPLPPATEPEAALMALIADWRATGINHLAFAADELEALVRASSPPPPVSAVTCEWREDADGVSKTDCGHVFALDDSSGVWENGLRFCHFCGERIALVAVPPSASGPSKP